MPEEKKGHWKLKWDRKREVSGGRFIRPRHKKWIWVSDEKHKKNKGE